MQTVHYNDLESLVGQDIGVSDWATIDQETINKFAEATGDFQWIHVDIEKAKAAMGTTIAHGFLVLSLVSKMQAETLNVEGVGRVINYGCNKVRFTNIVPSGSRVRLNHKVQSVEEKSGGKQVVSNATIELEGAEKPAAVVEALMVYFPQ